MFFTCELQLAVIAPPSSHCSRPTLILSPHLDVVQVAPYQPASHVQVLAPVHLPWTHLVSLL